MESNPFDNVSCRRSIASGKQRRKKERERERERERKKRRQFRIVKLVHVAGQLLVTVEFEIRDPPESNFSAEAARAPAKFAIAFERLEVRFVCEIFLELPWVCPRELPLWD